MPEVCREIGVSQQTYYRWQNKYGGMSPDMIKQLLGGQQPPTFKGQGPERAAGLSLWLYSVVWLWSLGQKPADRYFMVQSWYCQKTVPSFADAIACLCRRLWRERINSMFGVSAVHDDKFKFLLETLAPAA